MSAPGTVLLFTPAEGYTTVVRDLVIHNGAGSPASFYVFWSYQASSYFLFRGPVTNDQTVHVEMRQVVPAGALCYANGAAAGWTVVCTGYRLTGTGATTSPSPLPTAADANLASGNT